MSLAETQTQFFKAIFNNVADETLFQGDKKLVTERLAIYRNSILGNRFAALSRLFKCCAKMVGPDYWQQLLETFIEEQPSQSADITASGAIFATFLTNHDVTNHLPYLADLAHLEWAWHQCFHQAASQQGKHSLAQAVASHGDQLLLSLGSGTQLLSSPYPLYDLWQLCQQKDNSQALNLPEQTQPHYFILYREHDSIRIKQIDMAAWQICQLLQQEQSLLALCQTYQTEYGEALNDTVLTVLMETQIINWRD